MKKYDITVMGAGLVGSLLSILLAKRGYSVGLIEKRPDMRKSDISGGRSINLALSNRGLKALNRAGIQDKIEKMIIPMHGRLMHDLESNHTFQPYGQEGEFINSISRGGLNQLLLDTAEEYGVETHFEQQCFDVDLHQTTVRLKTRKGVSSVASDILIGADGAFSAVRATMQKTDRFDYEQKYLTHGYKELSIHPGKGGEFLLEKNALHIWPRGSFMLIALPNIDGSFTVTLFLAYEGNKSFSNLNTDEEILGFFKAEFPDALEKMPNLLDDFSANPTGSLVTVRCYPWVRNNTVLIGDACHAIVPFYGQGMNCGFEDCRVLEDLLNETSDDWQETMDKFQKSRKPDADAIADLALWNFIEMRDLVADDEFLLRKKIESRIHESYPNQWIPLYSMVTFNEDLRYSDALKRGQIQDKVMNEVMKIENIQESWREMDLDWIVEKYQKEINNIETE